MSGRRAILITGAASGIGAVLARRLAAPDVALLLHTRKNREGLGRVERDAVAAGALVRTAVDPATAPALITAAGQAFGGLDGLMHNAGFALDKPFGALTREELDHSGAAIRDAFFGIASAALPLLAASSCGRVVAVSSFAAQQFRLGGVVFAATAAARAGLEALVKALAVQLAPHGVTVNAGVPGFVEKDAGAHLALDDDATRRAPPEARRVTEHEATAV